VQRLACGNPQAIKALGKHVAARMRLPAVFVAVLLCAVPASAHPKLEVGKWYDVAEGCQQLLVPTSEGIAPAKTCHVDTVLILRDAKRGWYLVSDPKGNRWHMNLNAIPWVREHVEPKDPEPPKPTENQFRL
jgi:hypothetical protein